MWIETYCIYSFVCSLLLNIMFMWFIHDEIFSLFTLITPKYFICCMNIHGLYNFYWWFFQFCLLQIVFLFMHFFCIYVFLLVVYLGMKFLAQKVCMHKVCYVLMPADTASFPKCLHQFGLLLVASTRISIFHFLINIYYFLPSSFYLFRWICIRLQFSS